MRRVLLPLLIVACCAALLSAVWPQSTSHTRLKATLADAAVTTTSSTTTIPPTTTTSTTEPPTTTTLPHVVSTVQRTTIPRRPSQPVAYPAMAAKPPFHSGYATSCMDNAAHTVALAHQCWDGLVAGYSWSTSRAFSVLMCESEGNPWDYNPSGATGLMQDLPGPYDPKANMDLAYQKYTSAHGWGPWSASQSCWINASKG